MNRVEASENDFGDGTQFRMVPKIAVWPVIPSQANVRTRSLRIRGVHLDQRGQCRESAKRVVRLKTAKQDRKIAAVNWEPKTVPLFSKVEGQVLAGAISRSNTRLIQPSVTRRNTSIFRMAVR
jgi:hypothetical protein